LKGGSTVSRNESFSIDSDPTKVVEKDGVRFLGNEILVSLDNQGTFADAEIAALTVGGRVVGFDPNPALYKILLPTSSIASIETALQLINDLHHPHIIAVSANIILEI
jgi:hypothetical protein